MELDAKLLNALTMENVADPTVGPRKCRPIGEVSIPANFRFAPKAEL
jgi:hypothetical protein